MEGAFVLEHLPDLSMPKYTARYGPQTVRMAEDAVAGLAGMSAPRGCWVGLRYLVDSSAGDPQRRLKLILRAAAGTQGSRGDSWGVHLVAPFYCLRAATQDDTWTEGPEPLIFSVLQDLMKR